MELAGYCGAQPVWIRYINKQGLYLTLVKHDLCGWVSKSASVADKLLRFLKIVLCYSSEVQVKEHRELMTVVAVWSKRWGWLESARFIQSRVGQRQWDVQIDIKPLLSVEWGHVHLTSCSSPTRRNIVLEQMRVQRLAVVHEEMCSNAFCPLRFNENCQRKEKRRKFVCHRHKALEFTAYQVCKEGTLLWPFNWETAK